MSAHEITDAELKQLLKQPVVVIGLQVWLLRPATANRWDMFTRRRGAWDFDEGIDLAMAARVVRGADFVGAELAPVAKAKEGQS